MSVSGPSVLNVVETNPFRHLNHLSLKFISASDAYLKKYLAECLLRLKVLFQGFLKLTKSCSHTCPKDITDQC